MGQIVGFHRFPKNIEGRFLSVTSLMIFSLGTGGVPASVVHPCLHGAVCHCQIQSNLVIRSKNGAAIVQCGKHEMLFSE